MIQVTDNKVTEIMRSLAISWNGDFVEKTDLCRIELDNDFGKGSVTTYDVVPGLTAYVYDIVFYQDVEFMRQEDKTAVLYFIFCAAGHMYHRFEKDGQYEKLSEMRSVIASSGDSGTNYFKFPKDVALQYSFLVFRRSTDRVPYSGGGTFLKNTLVRLKDFIDRAKGTKHTGAIDFNIARFVSILIKNKRTDAVGRLLSQAAILNMLAAQLDSYKNRKSEDNAPLKSFELNKIVALNNFISKNMSKKITVAKLSEESGLNAKKLQDGCKYLYGESVNTFVKNVKLEHAKELIQTTDFTASEVAYEIGINSKSYFTKIFKERFGVLPSQYGKHLQDGEIIFELTYKSKMKPSFENSDLKDILETARDFNSKNSITGCLVTYETNFFQVLEGPKKNVLELYNRIKKDNRHLDIKLIWKGPKIQRTFGEWDLALVSEEGVFEIYTEGTLKHINIKEIFEGDNSPNTNRDIIWRRLRNLIKVA